MIDATSYAVLRQVLAGFALAGDTGRGLDEKLAALLASLAALPGVADAAVVLTDTEEQPVVRARLGAPDMGLVLSAALEHGPEARLPRVLRRGEAPVIAAEDGSVAARRREAAMLAAPILAGEAHLGWFCLTPAREGDASLDNDIRLAVLLAGAIAALAAMAGQGQEARLEMARELSFLRSKVSLRYEHVFFTGHSALLETLRGEIDKAALAEAPVFLCGEPGTGRSVLARLIHELSPRALRPFLIIDAAGGDGLDRRLFGGSRSLGSQGGPGALEEADGGTLCLVNAHLLPPPVVERLARSLSGGRFSRLGGDRDRPLGARLVFKVPPQGVGPDLTAAARPLVIRVPSLRQRREDIAALLAHFLDAEAVRGGRRLTLTSKALKTLELYDWPGNIREMETMVARLTATAPEDRVDMADIPTEMLAEGERPQVLPEDAAELRDMERQQVLSALERHGWVQSRAARELGLTLRQIGYRIRKYGLAREGE